MNTYVQYRYRQFKLPMISVSELYGQPSTGTTLIYIYNIIHSFEGGGAGSESSKRYTTVFSVQSIGVAFEHCGLRARKPQCSNATAIDCT